MATSKFPSKWVLIPEKLIQLNLKYPRMYLNIRPSQRRIETPDEVLDQERMRHLDGYMVHLRLRDYLRSLSEKNKKVVPEELPAKFALWFQGYGADDLRSTIIYLEDVRFCSEFYPKLIFEQSDFVSEISCPNFWGAFILALAPVNCFETFEFQDPDGEHFISFVDRFGL